MTEWHTVARAEDLPKNGRLRVELHEHTIGIFDVEGTLYAVSNHCPHAYGPLDQGFVEECRITCPWHGWSFPLSMDDRPNDGLPRFSVRVEDDVIQIALPPVMPRRTIDLDDD
jgi:nitrite reductase/ring-hydroxylating ferredoxin subunit